MESSYNGCPTEILIDLKEDDFLPSYGKIHTPFFNQKPMKCIENKENDSFEIKQDQYQCIMDMSPFRLRKECRNPLVNSNTNSEQDLDGSLDDCPTAVLIEVPNSSRMCSTLLYCNKSAYQQEDTVFKSKSLVQDAKVKKYNCLCEEKCSAFEDSNKPYDFLAMKNEISPPRLRWKTPSPQSMSCISKEASKIIHNLNSSALFEEDSLLCEEILPIPINFDNFDIDENSDQETSIPQSKNSGEDILSNYKTSVRIQTEVEIVSAEINNKVSDSSSSVIKNSSISSKYQNSLTHSPSEPFDSYVKGRDNSNVYSISSKELKSSEVQSGSFDYSEISEFNEETNDVFIENSLSSKDNESIQKREAEKDAPSKTLIRSKTALKNSVFKEEMENRPTLRNLSNVKHAVDSKYLRNSNKRNSTSHLKQNLKPNSKELESHGKQQLKKTKSTETQAMPKGISRSNSFHYNARESISSFQRPNSVKQKPSLLSESKFSSSYVKQAFTPMKTPSKRYSIATPLQSVSTKKSTMTPALSRFQNPSVPRFTPQSAGGNRLSFSKSWQLSSVSNSKGSKNQNFVPTSSAVSKPSFSRIYSSKPNKQALNQSISVLSSQASKNNSFSTTSKNRFCSKLNLPSPLPAEQDRKLARALFPSWPPK